MSRIRSIISLIRCKMNPVGYARSVGVTVGENVRFYGATPSMFSTEPWLITIGNNVHITSGVQFLTHDGGTLITREETGNFVLTGNITIEDNVYLGIRSVILPGVTIGKRSIIECCSVVSKDIEPNSVAAGVPCKVIRSVDDYVEKLKNVINGDDSKYYSDLDYMHSLNKRKK